MACWAWCATVGVIAFFLGMAACLALIVWSAAETPSEEDRRLWNREV